MATKARLHWVWRGAIASVCGAGCMLVAICVLSSSPPMEAFRALISQHFCKITGTVGSYVVISRFWLVQTWFAGGGVFDMFLYGAIASIVGLSVHGLLSRPGRSGAPDGETHCRRCNHILRGLSEPRCPECGEGI